MDIWLDFYEFSCGTFIKETVIPDHKSNQGKSNIHSTIIVIKWTVIRDLCDLYGLTMAEIRKSGVGTPTLPLVPHSHSPCVQLCVTFHCN